MAVDELRGLVERLYEALVAGDADGVRGLITPDFDARFTAGLPIPGDGRLCGAEAAIEGGWWALGRRFAVRAKPEEWVATADGRLLVLGTYVGRGRQSGTEFTATFAHVWTARDGRISSVLQVTDSVAFAAAL
jgi:2-(1,2-epoxy-1,2-dihydrophenyl)acetyl-CoA isomerase